MLDINSVRSVTTAPITDSDLTIGAPSGSGPVAVVLNMIAARLKASIVAADMIAIAAALAIATFLDRLLLGRSDGAVLAIGLISLPVWPLLFAQQGLYQSRRLSRRMEELRLVINASLAGVIVLAGISVLFQEPLSRGWLGLVFVAVVAAVALERELVRRGIGALRRHGLLTRRVLVVGENSEAQELAAMMRANARPRATTSSASSPKGRTDRSWTATPVATSGPYLGSAEHVVDLVRETDANGVVVATTGVNKDSANRLVRQLTRAGMYVEMTSAMSDISTSRISVRNLGRVPDGLRRAGRRRQLAHRGEADLRRHHGVVRDDHRALPSWPLPPWPSASPRARACCSVRSASGATVSTSRSSSSGPWSPTPRTASPS